MLSFIWCVSVCALMAVLSFQRAALIIWGLSLFLFLSVASILSGFHAGIIVGWILYALVFLPLTILPIRRALITKHLLAFYERVMPTMSRTEREAISAGTITWEGDLFKGNPNWDKLLAHPKASLTTEEQAFLDGPVENLCRMLCDWEITHNLADLPPAVWDYLKKQGFFALIIPKTYGGKEFSAYAHSQILIKISGRSITAASTVAVPNSLGPAELLLHYGTEEQKNYYLPRLANGTEIPCFALTSASAGSDAGAMVDHGIVQWGEIAGKKTLGILLNFDKRYITLAPIATVVGLAFKLYDPQHLLGNKTDIGITCALIPRNTSGITIGRRHFPLDTPFQNGPIQGKDVFIPLDWIIGGKAQAGKGWRMLMESLAAGRAISLPANAVGGAKVVTYASGAYARIRRQFNLPIGRFEGIEEPLARIGAYTYIMDAARTFATSCIDAGEKPAVASAIVKYHVTELGRKIACDGMDIHGGKGICLGPKNYLGRGYEAAPIAITVEGANILTRNMIIFGQGAMRCHPYVLKELEAARLTDRRERLTAFDKIVMQHVGFAISNFTRSFILGISNAIMICTPKSILRRYYQQATRFSSAFALIVDVCMLIYGGNLKRKESISARLGDILSYLYLLSAILKYFHDQNEPAEDLPIVRYATLFCLFEIQERFDEILRNFPSRLLACMLNVCIFPFGQRFSKPRDSFNHKIAQLLMAPTATRDRLTTGAFLSAGNNVLADIQDALVKTITAEPIDKIIKAAKKEGSISGYNTAQLAEAAYKHGLINEKQLQLVLAAQEARKKVIAVDDFSNEELSKMVMITPFAAGQ